VGHIGGCDEEQGDIEGPCGVYRGTVLIKNNPSLGPYGTLMSEALGRPYGAGSFLWARYPCRVGDSGFVVPGSGFGV
jgi:hypothetical protein